MKNEDFYSWRVIYPNGKIQYKGQVKLAALVSPFKFELISLKKNLENHSINVKENQMLIYFRRVFGKLFASSGKNSVEKILYCLGYRHGDYLSAVWINPTTGQKRIQEGKDIKL